MVEENLCFGVGGEWVVTCVIHCLCDVLWG